MVEAATVQTLKSLLTACNRVEFDINITFRIGVGSNVEYFAVFLVTFDFDFGFEVLDPVVAPVLLLPNLMSV